MNYNIETMMSAALSEIQSGGATRTNESVSSSYYDLVKDGDTGHTLSVSVIREWDGSAKNSWYSAHVIDDINGKDGFIVSTDHLDNGELRSMLIEIVSACVRDMNLVKNEVKPYTVEIVEEYHRTVIVYAESRADAEELTEELCNTEEIQVDSDCFFTRRCTCTGEPDESDLAATPKFGLPDSEE